MERLLHISTPYVKDLEGNIRLCVDTNWRVGEKNYEKTFFYQVGEEWGRYFVTEKSDAFILAFLEVAMENGFDIEFGAPVSEDLKYQLEHYLIPVFVQHFKRLHTVRLIGSVTREALPTEGVTGTGFSCGVDSFHAVLSHLHTGMLGKNVTHLILAVNGAAMTGFSEEIDELWYRETMERFSGFANELGLKLIGIRSNITVLNKHKTVLVGGDAVVTSAFVHALSKLFSTYYWASAWPADVLEFISDDGGAMEPFVLPLLSIRGGVRFYHAGSETNRVGKVRYIADNPVVQKALNVCGCPENCGHCVKCLRTMSELYAVGKLELFRQVFPVDDYMSHRTMRLAEELAIDHPPLASDILVAMRESGLPFPWRSIIAKWLVYKPLYLLKSVLRNNAMAQKIYYKGGLKEKLYGPIAAKYENEAMRGGKGKRK